jgi:hypothetical protein
MKVSQDHSGPLDRTSKAGKFDLADLVPIIGYRLTAYIGGNTNIQSVVLWLGEGLPPDLEPRMRAALDIVKPIAEAESELIAQGFLIGPREECGSYRTPAQMLLEADVETARSILMRTAVAEFLSNQVPTLEDVASRLQDQIGRVALPKGMGYKCYLCRGRLSLTLIHTGFPIKMQRKWDAGVDWPCWDQIIATVPEMVRARTGIDLTTGFPFRYLRAARLPAKEDKPNKTIQ